MYPANSISAVFESFSSLLFFDFSISIWFFSRRSANSAASEVGWAEEDSPGVNIRNGTSPSWPKTFSLNTLTAATTTNVKTKSRTRNHRDCLTANDTVRLLKIWRGRTYAEVTWHLLGSIATKSRRSFSRSDQLIYTWNPTPIDHCELSDVARFWVNSVNFIGYLIDRNLADKQSI